MGTENSKIVLNKELIPNLKSSAEKLIEQTCSHLVQTCLISGAIAAFLMPLFISKDFSSIQHFLIALSITCFLLSILIGMLHLSCKLTNTQRNLTELIDILENEDKERAVNFRKKHEKSLKWKLSIDVKGWLTDILFALGILILISVIFINETGWYYLGK